MIFGRKKGKKKDMELTDEETEVAFKPPLFEIRKKKKYKKKLEREKPTKTPPPTHKPKPEPEPEPKPEPAGPTIFEKEITIQPEDYRKINLGKLKRGTTIRVECHEVDGDNFSYWIVDKSHLEAFKYQGTPSKSLLSGRDDDEFDDIEEVKRDGFYYLILKSKAYEYERKVWYHVEMEEP